MGTSALSGLVVDASAFVELLLQSALGRRIQARISDEPLHAPAHIDAEVLSALGRLYRAGRVDETKVSQRLRVFLRTAIERYPLAPLLAGAWSRHHKVSLRDALYVELADQLAARLLTIDKRLAAASPIAELVE